MTDIMSSTNRDISGLTNGETYTFSVEVITVRARRKSWGICIARYWPDFQ